MCDWHGSVTHSCSPQWRVHFIPCSLRMRAATPQEEVNKTTALRKVQSAVQAAFKGTPQAGSVKVRFKPQTLNLVVLQVPKCAGSCHHPAGCPAAVTVGSRCFCSFPACCPAALTETGVAARPYHQVRRAPLLVCSRTLKSRFLCLHAQVQAFGSYVNNLGTHDSDVDVVITGLMQPNNTENGGEAPVLHCWVPLTCCGRTRCCFK